jgi:hypothetical protein
MTSLSRCLRVTGLASLPALLLAASWAPLLQVSQAFDPQQFRINEERWRILPEARREEARRQWQVYSEMGEDRRELYAQRMDVLRGTTASLKRILGREPRAAEIACQLDQIAEPLQEWLAGECALAWPVDSDTLHSALERELTGRIRVWLGRLVAEGGLTAGEAARILDQELSLILRDALRLHAGEQQRDGSEQPGLGLGFGFAASEAADLDGIAEQLRRSEREALEGSRSPAARGAREAGPGSADPLRIRLLKLHYIVERLREAGVAEQEIHALIMKSRVEVEASVGELLGPR